MLYAKRAILFSFPKNAHKHKLRTAAARCFLSPVPIV